ncbi:glycosyltransferase [Nocardioides euryhalodurans]|nr:glycosyltransferase [Nocardioides euryhalodurans]
MEAVRVQPVDLERLAGLLPADRVVRLEAAVEQARAAFGDRVVWHVNATARGGGVAEMLQTLLAYAQGAGIESRWRVLAGDPEFFAVTKRLHNVLHGEPGDGGPLGPAERDHYEQVLRANLADLAGQVSPGDIVLLHDPQTAGLAAGLRALGARVVWRCHVGRDLADDVTRLGWDFLRPYVSHAEAVVFSRREYAPDWVDDDTLWVIPPSIDPLAVKNMALAPELVVGILARVGLVTDGGRESAVDFLRRDGSPGTVRSHRRSGGLLQDTGPPPPDVPLVVQVSRWDRLKDMAGVMEGFVRAVEDDDLLGAHLVLAGPEVSGVADDPEGAQVLSDCREEWRHLGAAVRGRVHLACIPMDDVDENAIIVNALQRYAAVVVQKSLVEGFGLTVTEALWKGRPVVASRLGGIQDQIVDGRDGLLVDDPYDIEEFAAALRRPLADAALAARLGAAAHARVLEEYVGDRHLEQYVDLFSALVRGTDPGGPRTGGPAVDGR